MLIYTPKAASAAFFEKRQQYGLRWTQRQRQDEMISLMPAPVPVPVITQAVVSLPAGNAGCVHDRAA